ncbi:MAG: hypothetical protein JJT78_17710 [Leptospira sp.]|nr:hypothetical protein [Leptospira sp.]
MKRILGIKVEAMFTGESAVLKEKRKEKKRVTRIFASVLKSANNRMASSLKFLANRFTDLDLERFLF